MNEVDMMWSDENYVHEWEMWQRFKDASRENFTGAERDAYDYMHNLKRVLDESDLRHEQMFGRYGESRIAGKYDWDGKPISTFEWTMLRTKGVHVGEDLVGPYRISTVWLGLDHGWYSDVPIIFETMIFGGDENDPLSNYQERYATKQEALLGHALAVKKCKAKIKRIEKKSAKQHMEKS